MKPRIFVHSEDSEDTFRWTSDGWFQQLPPLIKREGPEGEHDLMASDPKAKALMAKAKKCVVEGNDVLDVIARLEAAGFECLRQPGSGPGLD